LVGSTIGKAEEEKISVYYWIVCAVCTNERETSRGGSSIGGCRAGAFSEILKKN